MTDVRPPAPPPYRSPPAPEPRPLPPRLARLGARHPLVIAAVIVSLAVTAVTAGATVVAFAARTWWVFDILTSFRPQYALILLIAVVMLAALRCWKMLVVAVIALTLNLWQVAPILEGHQAAPRAGSPTLTIAHLNLQSRTGDLRAMRAWLVTRPADVLVLLHTTIPTAEGLMAGAHGYRMIYPVPDGQKRNGGVRFSPRSPEVLVLTDRADITASTPTVNGLPDAAVELAAHLGDQTVSLLGVHTVSPGSGERHRARDEQLVAITRWLESTPRPAIAFGDFNATYYSPAVRTLLHDAHAQTSQIGFGIQATWPHQFRPAGIAIDQSVYTGALTAIGRHRGPSFGSEHRSLLVTYAFAR